MSSQQEIPSPSPSQQAIPLKRTLAQKKIAAQALAAKASALCAALRANASSNAASASASEALVDGMVRDAALVVAFADLAISEAARSAADAARHATLLADAETMRYVHDSSADDSACPPDVVASLKAQADHEDRRCAQSAREHAVVVATATVFADRADRLAETLTECVLDGLMVLLAQIGSSGSSSNGA